MGGRMPDFDTRRPQGQNVPNEPRRIGLVANKLRSALMASRLRALLIGGGLLLFVVAVPVGLLTYAFSHQENDGSRQDLSEAAQDLFGGGELKSAIPVGPEQLKSTT